mgnify:CR=1 FL=1
MSPGICVWVLVWHDVDVMDAMDVDVFALGCGVTWLVQCGRWGEC